MMASIAELHPSSSVCEFFTCIVDAVLGNLSRPAQDRYGQVWCVGTKRVLAIEECSPCPKLHIGSSPPS